MLFVTVTSKFQDTIQAGLRKDINLSGGGLMEATLVGDGILLRPRDVADRKAAADHGEIQRRHYTLGAIPG